MWQRIIVLISLILFLATACSTMGEVTGKAVKGVDNAADDFKDGYRKGRGQ
ncbi:MAG: hypothetical protein RBR42_11595 [Desulfomicrobium sp.]|jgi:hypothetical protein|nr:hypothetical protein [Desulfomicrobium sp.]NLV98099.1 hypothetical protein [Desulfovibrionales bacterium]